MGYLTAPSGTESYSADISQACKALGNVFALRKVVVLLGERILGTCGMSTWKGLAALGGQPGLETKALGSSQAGPVSVLALTTSALVSFCSSQRLLGLASAFWRAKVCWGWV